MRVNRTAAVTESGNGLGKTFANILLKNKYDVILAASTKSFELLSRDADGVVKYKLIETDFTSEKSLLKLIISNHLRINQLQF